MWALHGLQLPSGHIYLSQCDTLHSICSSIVLLGLLQQRLPLMCSSSRTLKSLKSISSGSWGTSSPSFLPDWGAASAASPSFSSTCFWHFLAFLKHMCTEVPPAQLRGSAAPCMCLLELAGSCWNQGNPWPLLKEAALQHTAPQQPPPRHPLLTLNTETVSSIKSSWTTNTNNFWNNQNVDKKRKVGKRKRSTEKERKAQGNFGFQLFLETSENQ